MKMSAKTRNIITLILLMSIVIILLGMAIVLHQKTLIEWWKPLVICTPFAVISGAFLITLTTKITCIRMRFINCLIGMAVVLSLTEGGFYILNYYYSDPLSNEECKVAITGKHTEKRYHTKRLSRNRSVRGEPYTVYHISMEIPGDKIKTIEVSASQYARTHIGENMCLKVEKGLLGAWVIKNLSFPIRERRSSRSNRKK